MIVFVSGEQNTVNMSCFVAFFCGQVSPCVRWGFWECRKGWVTNTLLRHPPYLFWEPVEEHAHCHTGRTPQRHLEAPASACAHFCHKYMRMTVMYCRGVYIREPGQAFGGYHCCAIKAKHEGSIRRAVSGLTWLDRNTKAVYLPSVHFYML